MNYDNFCRKLGISPHDARSRLLYDTWVESLASYTYHEINSMRNRIDPPDEVEIFNARKIGHWITLIWIGICLYFFIQYL